MVRRIEDEFERMREEFNRLFESMIGGGSSMDFGRPLLGDNSRSSLPDTKSDMFEGMRVPSLNLREKENEYEAELEIPGVDKENIKLDTKDGMLRVKADTSHENKDEDDNKGYYKVERSYTGFYRTLPLPEDADEDNIKASYKDGVLHVNIPKGGKEDDVKYINID